MENLENILDNAIFAIRIKPELYSEPRGILMSQDTYDVFREQLRADYDYCIPDDLKNPSYRGYKIYKTDDVDLMEVVVF